MSSVIRLIGKLAKPGKIEQRVNAGEVLKALDSHLAMDSTLFLRKWACGRMVAAPVVALWLGHQDPTTTHQYIEADLLVKEQATISISGINTSQTKRLGFHRAFSD